MIFSGNQAWALTGAEKVALVRGESEQRLQMLDKVLAQGDVTATVYLQQLLDDAVRLDGDKVLIVTDEGATNVMTGERTKPSEAAEEVINNNRIQSELEASIATLNLLSQDASVRLAAAQKLQGTEANSSRLLLIAKAEKVETDGKIRALLQQVRASIELTSDNKATRLAAAATLAASSNSSIKQMLSSRLAADGETDAEVKAAITQALKKIDRDLATFELLGQVFTGISLGSILLLAALGLAVTYGLMGVINMAHGEMMMIGAYATFLVQNLFLKYLPAHFQWYLLAAIPAAFLLTALVGILIERSVLRSLYGRPLETLLATWGISLILMQSVRSLFGAQNVQVENPAWMSGGIEVAANLVLPYNRIFIIAFAALVLVMMWLMISKTRLGLFIRAVTQNRGMASCSGVNTSKVDALAFGLGSGIAGLAGVALSQIGNVGPALGQSYIVDSFMVVVLGGVGQLAGAVYAALGLGILSKFFEGMAGAVLAKILILVIVIIFIQKRPQGLFAFKGRVID
ncbi:MAG: urea ABC transporter permease subunit UrtB [Methylophilaceae bacterium]|nr:urea ABC transporter permease subunit UrtB [Methylophilaceae bacterium]